MGLKSKAALEEQTMLRTLFWVHEWKPPVIDQRAWMPIFFGDLSAIVMRAEPNSHPSIHSRNLQRW
jgi:hypothetical protein